MSSGQSSDFYLRPDKEKSHRVGIDAFIFSPDGKNFCEFMTPNVPKPRFLAQFHPGLVGALTVYFYKK